MNILIDVIFVLFVLLMFFLGYRKGFLTKAWWLIDLGLIVVCGIFIAPSILAPLKKTSMYAGLESNLSSLAGRLNIEDASSLADLIFNICIWLALAIVIIIVMAIFKSLLRKLTNYKAFSVIDKVLGGVYSAVIVTAFLIALGAVAGTFVQFAPVASASEMCSETYIFRYVFGANPFQPQADKYLDLGGLIYKLLNK